MGDRVTALGQHPQNRILWPKYGKRLADQRARLFNFSYRSCMFGLVECFARTCDQCGTFGGFGFADIFEIDGALAKAMVNGFASEIEKHIKRHHRPECEFAVAEPGQFIVQSFQCMRQVNDFRSRFNERPANSSEVRGHEVYPLLLAGSFRATQQRYQWVDAIRGQSLTNG